MSQLPCFLIRIFSSLSRNPCTPREISTLTAYSSLRSTMGKIALADHKYSLQAIITSCTKRFVLAKSYCCTSASGPISIHVLFSILIGFMKNLNFSMAIFRKFSVMHVDQFVYVANLSDPQIC